jgi:hypothetical protein
MLTFPQNDLKGALDAPLRASLFALPTAIAILRVGKSWLALPQGDDPLLANFHAGATLDAKLTLKLRKRPGIVQHFPLKRLELPQSHQGTKAYCFSVRIIAEAEG